MQIYDAVIVGAGPAGIACALRCRELGMSPLVLEANNVLNTLKNYPEGKLLFGVPGYYKEEPKKLIALWEEDLERAKIEVRDCEPVDNIKKEHGYFSAITYRGEYAAKSVVLAFGMQGTPNRLGVPGEDMPHVHYALHDPKKYKSKKVLVVGGGDTAIEAAALLAGAGAKVVLSYRRDNFFRAKEENVRSLNASGAKTLFNTQMLSVKKGSATLAYADGKKEALQADHVFVLIGSKANTEILEKIGIPLNAGGVPVFDKSTFESGIPGIYIIGDLAGTATILPALYAGFIIAPAILARSRQ